MFGFLVEEIRLAATGGYTEARTKAQQYHGMISQGADDGTRKSHAGFHKKFGQELAKKSGDQDRGHKPTQFGRKKLRSLKPDHEPAYGDRVADDRKFLAGRNKDPLAAKAAKSTRERRRDIRKAARGHR